MDIENQIILGGIYMQNNNLSKAQKLLEDTVTSIAKVNSNQAKGKVFEFVRTLGRLRVNELNATNLLFELSVRVRIPLKANEVNLFLKEYRNSYTAEGSRMLQKRLGLCYLYEVYRGYNSDFGIYEPKNKEEIEKITYKFFLENEARELSNRECKDYIDRLKAIAFLNEEDINLHEKAGMIKVKNGLYSLSTEVLHKHMREHYATTCIATEYYRDEECPMWEEFIEETFSLLEESEKEKAVNLLQEFMGYSLIPGNEYQKCLFLLGKPRTGKSVILDVWQEVLGTSNTSSIPLEKLNDETKIGELLGKYINVSGELERGKRIDTTFLKSLIGEDRIMGRNLYKNPFYFTNRAKLVAAGNQLPYFDDVSGAMLERAIILKLDNVVPLEERDPDLRRKLLEEKEGILKWMLEGLKRLKARGYFLELETTNEVKEAIEFKSNSVIYWWNECSQDIFELFIEGSENIKKLYLKEALDSYRSFCKSEEIIPEKRKDFIEMISEIEEVKVYRDSKLNQYVVECTLECGE